MLIAKATSVARVALLAHQKTPPTPLISAITGTADAVEASSKQPTPLQNFSMSYIICPRNDSTKDIYNAAPCSDR